MRSKDIKNPRDFCERVFIGSPNGIEIISEEEHERRLNRDAMERGGTIRIKNRGKPVHS